MKTIQKLKNSPELTIPIIVGIILTFLVTYNLVVNGITSTSSFEF